ncbi:TPA: hemagglutinin repeat-containing protein [Klebsiella pneumoniae]|uniref:two-partner secretion domain-containing protein n=2 Tax=Klebsiella pneumoniae TaxID=573 RepID=UPI000C79AC1A|nr:hemagglutinin repeat-containing protein [Klebsiella pneumoniae]HDT2974438.1 hemagglutinin repeat-containing protein [Klebsiella pneumoniae subsp. pneumoniae]EIW0248496.1 filamentous hemagglutinin N-terminal domain-containing protein [Klebsiella pneumoniae]EIW1283930.1 filamentous hemagglutinin N-terminal domain-containing protein [Klebsiella pneumoniae]EKW9957487.1 hemagglutinin repeat-containing protein [Klebsiella pneumoniae]ELP0879275.1 hemagglutinin repeat-containing protein [Klebsiella
MNKRFYRIVFNKARGMLMVVAETTRSHRAGVSPQSGADARTGSTLISSLAPLAFSFLLAFSCLTPAQAAIVADNHAPGGQQPQIANSANGTPQVNIQTPSGAGVSRNVYSQFDVDGRGVVLNNSRANTSTQLAGMVAGNPNLAKGEARVILNEVNTRDPSRLNGYIEVAGQKAQVVIANPAGISCDGCGFINANRATLTTGQVQYGNGQISGYDVNRGEILVQGGGLDASSVDSTDLLARAVKINAGVWAQELKVTAGRNQIDAAHSRTTAKSADGSALPAVAIDVSALGGMYAHKIRLVGTERGVGVHNAGNIGAAAGDVAISADGALSNRGVIQSAQNLQLSVKGDLHNQGQLYAGKDSVVTASATLTNDGMIAAQGDTRIAANALRSAQNSTLAAGLNSDGSTASSGALTLNSQSSLALNGRNMAAGTLTAQGRTVDLDNSRTSGARIVVSAASGDITTRDAVVAASEKLQLAASGKLNNHSGLLTASKLELKAMALDNQQGVIQQTGEDDLRLDFRAGLDNRGGEIASNSHALTLSISQLLNQNGTLLHTGSGGMSITSEGALDNGEGTIAANGNIVLHSDNIINRSGKISTTQGNAQLTTRHELENSQGNIVAGGSLSLQVASLRNQQGQLIAAQGDLAMSAEEGLDNREGVLTANGNIKLDADNLTNHGGKISAAQGDVQLTARHGVNNSQGNIIASGDIRLQAENLNNRHGQIGTAQRGSVNLTTSGLLDNQQGTITAFDALGIQSATVDNRQGELQSGGNLNITIHNRGLDNRQGQIVSAAALEIAGVNLALTNTGGTLLAASKLSLDADSLSGDGEVLSQGDMSLTLRQAFHNAGRVIANGNLQWNLSGLGLINQGVISAGRALNLYAAKLDNRQEGEISAGENHLTVNGELVNRGLIDGGLTHIVATTLTNIGSGRLYGDAVALQAATLTNAAENGVAATIAARASLAMGVGTLNNQDHALIYSDGTLAIGGQLAEDGSLSGRAGVFNNHSATLESAGDMALDIQQINNYNDHLVTKDVMVEQSWRHEAALKGSVQRFDWSLVDTSYKNKYGVHDAIMPDGSRGDEFYEYQYQRTVVETQVVESDPGKILSGGQLIINSDKLNNYDSQIIAGGALGGVIGELNNVATTGKRVTTDVGTQTRWYEKKTSRPFGGTKTSQGKKSSEYEPTPTVQTIDLQTMKWQGNTQIDGHSGVINPRDRADETGEIPAGRLVEVTPVNADGTVIRVVTPDTRLPVSSLYQIDPQAKAGYLVETDPRFTNGKAWLASDYMQNQLGVDQAMKRLGDGYYEQRLVREQIVKLSGGRYLQGYSNDEEQYRVLMDAGVAFAKQYNLTVGVALTPAQMALLTSDMVWLVAREVTLTDGSVQQVLVPQVYARVKAGDLDGSGALLGGENVAFSVSRDVTNSGHIQSRGVTQLTAENIHNSGYIGGNQLTLNARTDINNIGGTLQGGDSLIAQAGRDINSASTLGGGPGNISLDRPAGIYVQNENGQLGLQALHNINLTASMVSNSAAGSQTQIIAGNGLNLQTLATTHSESGNWGKGNDRSLTQRSDIGTQINGGAVALSAGHDMIARAASVTATSSLTVAAGNDINLSSGESSWHLTENSHQSSSGLLARRSLTTHDEVWAQNAIGSNFSGDSIVMQAGRDLLVSGSSVAGTQDVNLVAGRNLTITTAKESRQENHLRKEKHSGFSGTGGVGFSVGSSSLKANDVTTALSSAASTVGSSQGNLSLSAGNVLTVQGSDLVAGNNMALTGKTVNILAAENQSTQTHTVEQKTSGLTLALSGMVGSAINTAVSSANQASTESNGRLAALSGLQSALSGVQAYQASQMQTADSSPESMIGVNLSWGRQSSKSTQRQTQNTSRGSSLMAGNNLSIIATETDINVEGSQLQASGSALLNAARDVNLFSAENASTLSGKNESHGSSFGVGINFGQGANGLTVSASANAAKGHEKGNSLTHNETTLSAGERVTIVSGRDTTLTGAQVSGHQVTMDVGRNLTLSSEQDSDNYDSKQRSGSAGASGSMGGGSGSLNLSQSKMHSTWASVEAQTGIFAGEGGFDVKVGGHTQLNGSVLASTAAAELNRLDTGTLGFRDIKNYAEYSVEQQSAGVSTSGSVAGQFLGNAASGLLMGANGSGSDSSLTRAAVSEGSIVIRDGANQQQDVTGLSRDAAHANQTLSPIFDKEKEQNRLATAQKIGEIGRQVSDVLVTQGKLNAQAAQSDPTARAAARAKLVAGGNGSPSEEQISAQVSRTATADYDTGGKYQKVAQAVTAAMQGLAGGNLAQAASGAVSPYVAEIIHSQTTDSATGKVNVEANAMAHAVWGAIAAASGNNSALAGAAGAVSGELLGRLIAAEYYPDVKTEELSDEQKSTISALSTLAAGLMGGLSGSSSADAVAGAQAGKNAVENNLLSGSEDAQAAWLRQHGIDMASCSDNPGGSACQKAINERNAVGLALASGSVALLPGGAQAMWGLGASANAGISYLADGSIDPANAAIAGWVNVISMGNGLAGTVGWNAAGGALGNWIDDKDPLSGALINGAGSGIGYSIGKGLSWGVNAGANWWKGGWDPKFNAELRQFTEIKGDFGISKEMTPSRVPGAFGDFGGSFFSEITGKGIEKRTDSMGERKND